MQYCKQMPNIGPFPLVRAKSPLQILGITALGHQPILRTNSKIPHRQMQHLLHQLPTIHQRVTIIRIIFIGQYFNHLTYWVIFYVGLEKGWLAGLLLMGVPLHVPTGEGEVVLDELGVDWAAQEYVGFYEAV